MDGGDSKKQDGGGLPPMPFVDDAAEHVIWMSRNEERTRRLAFMAAIESSAPEVLPPMRGGDDLPVLLSKALITAYERTLEGDLIKAVLLPLREIVRKITEDPSLIFRIDPRKWEEIVASTYDASGRFDEVTLTPRSGDGGRDLIAVKHGFGSVRIVESVKRYSPGTKATADDVRALLGVLHADHQATKGIVSTTWEFAPMIAQDKAIMQYVPHRLELVDGAALVQRLNEYAKPSSK